MPIRAVVGNVGPEQPREVNVAAEAIPDGMAAPTARLVGARQAIRRRPLAGGPYAANAEPLAIARSRCSA